MQRILSGVFSAIMALSAFSLSAFADSNLEQKLRASLQNHIAEQKIAGAVFHATIDGEIFEIAVGLRDRTDSEPMSKDSRFYIASSGKMMVAAAVLALVEDGDISLDDQVWQYIKSDSALSQITNIETVTVRQLLNHTSGLAEYLHEDFLSASEQNPSRAWTALEALEFAFDEPPFFSPNTAFEYTNTNYVLLGHLLEKFDGSLSQSLNKRIFSRAKMNKTTVGASLSEPNIVRGYDRLGNDRSDAAWASVLGDGPVVASASDVAKFMTSLMSSQKVLTDGVRQQMLHGSEHQQDYGLGIATDEDDLGFWYGHSGSYDGYEADVRWYPEEEIALVLLLNGNTDGSASFLDFAAETLTQQY